jgi:hypothetical protein
MMKLYDNPTELSDILNNQRVSDVCRAVVNTDVEDLHGVLDFLHPADVTTVTDVVAFSGLAVWVLL